MNNIYLRTQMMLGNNCIAALQRKHVAVFGLGGVGGSVVEALARIGVGTLTIVDHDVIQEHNINRQIIALFSTIGKLKTDVCSCRVNDINPQIRVIKYPIFVDEKTINSIDLQSCDYIVDAIDTVGAKILLIKKANHMHIPIVSCMGTGNRIHPELLHFDKIENTSYCGLCRIMRKKCREEQIVNLDVLYSKEKIESLNEQASSRIPGSVSFVPPVAGMLIAGKVIRYLISSSSTDK